MWGRKGNNPIALYQPNHAQVMIPQNLWKVSREGLMWDFEKKIHQANHEPCGAGPVPI